METKKDEPEEESKFNDGKYLLSKFCVHFTVSFIRQEQNP
jgi:hypothetical protein